MFNSLSKIFDYEGSVMGTLIKITDIVILNILTLICSIPIVTIGAAQTALYTITMKKVRDEDSGIVKPYFKAFKDNFTQTTISFLILLIVGAFVGFNLYITRFMPDPIHSIVTVALNVIAIAYYILVVYLFPNIARFESTVFGGMKNALLMGIRALPYTVLLALMDGILFAIIFFWKYGFTLAIIFGLIFGVAAIALVKSYLFVKIFKRY